MSFSYDVKEEMAKHFNSARHCQIAELAAIISLCGHLRREEDAKEFIVSLKDKKAIVSEVKKKTKRKCTITV